MKKMTIEVKKTIAVAPDKVWPTIASGTGVNKWFPVIDTCRVEGDQRYCTMIGGGDLVETLIKTDHKTRSFIYSVDKHPLPWGPVDSKITVKDAGMGKSEIVWHASFDCAEETQAKAKAMLEDLYGQGIDALETYHRMAA